MGRRALRVFIRSDLSTPAQVRRLTGYIDSRLHEQLHLEAPAAVAGVGVWTFARRFRVSFGRTPHAYVIERRIDRARRLLAQSRLPIKEVASVCGFADQALMTRVFQTHLRTLRRQCCAFSGAGAPFLSRNCLFLSRHAPG